LNSAAPLMLSGKFRYHHLKEASALAEFLGQSCPNPRAAIMGLCEILVNAIEHGNLGITYDEKSALQKEDEWMTEIERRMNLPENSHKYVDVEFKRTESEIRITVIDQGKGFDWHCFEELNPEGKTAKHGRGIVVAKNLAFKYLEYAGKGNEVTCVIDLK